MKARPSNRPGTTIMILIISCCCWMMMMMMMMMITFSVPVTSASTTTNAVDLTTDLDRYHTAKRKLWITMTTPHVPMNCTWGGSPMCCQLLGNSSEVHDFYPHREKLPSFHHLGGGGGHGGHAAKAAATTKPTTTTATAAKPTSSSTSPTSSTATLSTKKTNTTAISNTIHPHPNLRRQLGYGEFSSSSSSHNGECKTQRIYIPSPYEMYHIGNATEFANITDFNERKGKLMDFIEQDIDNTNKWLRRVDFHMRDTRSTKEKYQTPPHPDDLQYLSRFNVTTTCHGGISHHWIEWIEPLTVHARHPNGLIEHCSLFLQMEIRTSSRVEFHASDLTSPDYVLIQDNDDYHHTKLLGKHLSPIRRKYFFDAGANYFNTGTAWFTCAYLQKGIDFDHIYAIEYAHLDPIQYFKITPPRIVPFVHLMNVPASANHEDSGSILRAIQQVAREQDFVSFKLDIDTPEIEIPMFLELLRNDEYSSLIDEFFFELHFRCEFLAACGWGEEMAPEVDGFKMERSNVMKAFQQLRYKGMRAHFWP